MRAQRNMWVIYTIQQDQRHSHWQPLDHWTHQWKCKSSSMFLADHTNIRNWHKLTITVHWHKANGGITKPKCTMVLYSVWESHHMSRGVVANFYLPECWSCPSVSHPSFTLRPSLPFPFPPPPIPPSPPLPNFPITPPFLFPPLPWKQAPLNPARGLGEHWKLPSRVWERKSNLFHCSLKIRHLVATVSAVWLW